MQETDRERYRKYLKHIQGNMQTAVKWCLFGILSGLVVGFFASIFAKGILLVTSWRMEHGWIIFLLPIAGLFITWIYQKGGEKAKGGTNLVITIIRHKDEVPARLAPLIFISTVLTHLFGGSAGREGAALQMGGSLGSTLGRLFHFRLEEQRRVILCGMSAAFSALFGTPLAAMVLPMEISTVGIVYYSAMVPCALSSLTAHYVANALNLSSGRITHGLYFEKETMMIIFFCALFAILAAVISVIFSISVHRMEERLEEWFPNEYLRIFAAGSVLVILSLLFPGQIYNGTGSLTIHRTLMGNGAGLPWYAFLVKILFTVLTLAAGYKGGEIVPSLFIGAAFGNLYGKLIGVNPAAYAAIGMGAMFCGITNCPLTSMLICFELFGFQGIPYFMIAIPVTYLLSGNYGVYSGQKIRYSKFRPGRIDAHTH